MLNLKRVLKVVFPSPQFGVILQALTELDENLALSAISWSFYEAILEHNMHIWIFIKPLFLKWAQMFYSASRDWDPYILLNSFNLMLQFAVASVHSLAVNLSAGKQAVFLRPMILRRLELFSLAVYFLKTNSGQNTFLNWLRSDVIAVSLHLSVMLTGINKDSLLLVTLACGGSYIANARVRLGHIWERRSDC